MNCGGQLEAAGKGGIENSAVRTKNITQEGKAEPFIFDTKTRSASQRSLHNAPIFRLLLKVAVNGTHQCDFFNF